MDLIPDQIVDERDWWKSVIDNLLHPFYSTNMKELKDFTIIEGQLYYCDTRGILALAILEDESKEELERIYNSTYADKDKSL